MERFVSDPIVMPGHDFARADLEFLGLDHSTSSFEARVFADNPEADESTSLKDESYVGSFHIFGHGGCYGDIGHCDLPTGPPDPFDQRLPHQLTPANKTVIATEAIKRLAAAEAESFRVTVVAVEVHSVSTGERHGVLLQFERLSLITYAA
jgi:hypothetical protein